VQKFFDLNGLQQASLWVKAVTEQITTNTQDIEQLKEDNAQMRKELDDLKKQLSLQRNKTEDIFEFKF
jgi:cell division protein FtsB